MAQPPNARPDRTALGIGLILISVFTMAFADAVVKLVSTELTIWQLFVTRSLVAIAILAVVMAARGVGLRPRAPAWTLLRSALLVLAWLAVYASLPVLSLSVAAVAVYTNPIMIALLSAVLIGEAVTGRRWVGVLLGFLGVFAILRPGSDAFSWFTLLPLLGAAFYASAVILTRSKCQDEAPLALGLALHGSFLMAGLIGTALLSIAGLSADTQAIYPFLLGDWAPMAGAEWGLMALLGALSAGYFVGVARAYQIAAPSVIATFDYAYLVAAALWSFVLFSEIPSVLTVGGMVVIAVAGILVAVPSSRTATADRATSE